MSILVDKAPILAALTALQTDLNVAGTADAPQVRIVEAGDTPPANYEHQVMIVRDQLGVAETTYDNPATLDNFFMLGIRATHTSTDEALWELWARAHRIMTEDLGLRLDSENRVDFADAVVADKPVHGITSYYLAQGA